MNRHLSQSPQPMTDLFTVSTSELRWFIEWQVPAEVTSWYLQAGHPPTRQPTRIDRYLNQTGGGVVGIKLREGRLELKERCEQHGAIHLHPQVEGMSEGWRKWSFRIEATDSLLGETVDSATAWTTVAKARWLRRYSLAGSRGAIASSTEALPGQGVDFELTQIQLGDKHWWTLGLEAFGAAAGLRKSLLHVAAIVFSDELPLNLSLRDSRAYPAWLNSILSKESTAAAPHQG